MSRLVRLRSLILASLTTLGIVVACRATAPEAPPMGPHPDRLNPIARPIPGPTFPNPDADLPKPQPGPVTLRELPSPNYQASALEMQAPVDAAVDVGALADAQALPPIGDAMPTDAAKTLQP